MPELAGLQVSEAASGVSRHRDWSAQGRARRKGHSRTAESSGQNLVCM